MLRLILFRHAKAEAGEGADVDRPLADRGRQEAKVVGQLLQARGFVPDTVLASMAARAAETLDLAKAAWTPEPRIRKMPAVYGLMAGEYVELARNEGGEAKVLMIVGHNPAMERTAARFAKTGDAGDLKRLRDGMVTASVAVIDFEVERWAQIGPGGGHLVAFLGPRDS